MQDMKAKNGGNQQEANDWIKNRGRDYAVFFLLKKTTKKKKT